MRTYSSNRPKEGETLNGRLIAKMENSTDDLNGGQNARQKTGSLTENGEPDGGWDARRKAESLKEGETLYGGRNAQRTTNRRNENSAESRMPDRRQRDRRRAERLTEDGEPNGSVSVLRTQSSNRSKEGETLNGRLIAEMENSAFGGASDGRRRPRWRAERLTEDG